METLICTIDQSTTSTKTQLFSPEEQLLHSEAIPHTQIYPQSNWIEHDPLEILSNTVTNLRNCLEFAQKEGLLSSNTQMLFGITNQRETLVTWSKSSGLPLYNAIVWNDARTKQICQNEIERMDGDAYCFQSQNGLRIAEYFSVFKLLWLLENSDQVKKAYIEGDLLVGTIDSWLLYHLSEENNHFTDVTNASRTFLMDLNKRVYSSQILEYFNLDESILPQIKPNLHEFGTINFSKLYDPKSIFNLHANPSLSSMSIFY
jgi:glycerol kinase